MHDELREHVRDEAAPNEATVVVRGGPNTLSKLVRHAARTNRAYQMGGQIVWGISVFLALDSVGSASLEAILSGRLSTYRIVHSTTVSRVKAAGLDLLPTFKRPHFTLLIDDPEELASISNALGPRRRNPYHENQLRG